MNSDLISRSALLEEIKRIGGHPWSKWETAGVVSMVNAIPAVDVPKWIGVKDRLPEQSGDVLTLTLTDDGKQVMRVVSLSYSKKWETFNADDRNDEAFVKKVGIYPHFWMPMPCVPEV